MIHVQGIEMPTQKAQICDSILRSLPNWFGVEESIVAYTSDTQSMPFWAAYDGSQPIGFIAPKRAQPLYL